MVEKATEASCDCVYALAVVCQAIICDAAAWPAVPDLGGLPARFETVPVPTTYTEALMAVAVLTQFTCVLGANIHRRFHRRDGQSGCRFDSDALTPLVRIDRWNPGAWNPAAAVMAWTARYGLALAVDHDLVVERAKLRLGRDLAQHVRMRSLARELACSVPVLRRRFVSKAGETPIRYQTRLRAIEAVRLMRSTSWKMDAIGRAVGWKSRKDIYTALADVAGQSPAAIRALSDGDAARLLERMTPR